MTKLYQPNIAVDLVLEALAEDERAGDESHFDRDGFLNGFFPGDNPETVRDAWRIYEAIVYCGIPASTYGIKL